MNASARSEAIQLAKQWLSRKPVYLDTETTGTGPNDVVIEISVIDHDGTVLVDSLVKAVGKISPGARAVHNISDQMLTGAPGWETVWTQVESVITNRVVGIYNVDFDVRMMRQSHQRNWLRWTEPAGVEFFCIMKLYAQYYGQWNPRHGNYRWQPLDRAREQCGLSLPNSHRAKEDTLLTRALLNYMAAQ